MPQFYSKKFEITLVAENQQLFLPQSIFDFVIGKHSTMVKKAKNKSNAQKQERLNPMSLQEKVVANGGSNGYALESSMGSSRGKKYNRSSRKMPTAKKSKTPRDVYGRPKRNNAEALSTSTTATIRTFDRNISDRVQMTNIATPSFIQQEKASSFQTSKRKTPHNPYKAKSNAPPSSAKYTRYTNDRALSMLSKHIVCAISENLARETCITTMDATAPTTLEIHKMANGQTYIETLSYLEMIGPHEIVLNEGRRNSQLCRKVVALFDSMVHSNIMDDTPLRNDKNSCAELNECSTNFKRTAKRGDWKHDDKTNYIGLQTPAAMNKKSSTPHLLKKGESDMQTIVKFLPRSYFDQTRGAELLQRVVHDSSYDPSIINEYIVLSSSHALAAYIQSCLGKSLKICMNWGGRYRMAIDRNTISHLELLSNAKTGKNKNSLISTIDCTKTNIGSRLLRSNLISPPTGIATINARLDLVDDFLDDEEFFYEVLGQLEALPDIDKMMAHISLVPDRQRATKRKRTNGKTKQVTARMVSRGISALVCIKSTLSVIPNFARVLEI